MDMKGKLAFVTGATGGVGQAVAKALAKIGCDLVITGLGDEETISGIVNSIKSEFKVNIEHLAADLRQVDQIEALTSKLLERHPTGVDILINCAGVLSIKPIEEQANIWNDMMAINLSAPFHFIRLLLPTMKTKGWGRIVNIASVVGCVAMPDLACYCATKHGLVGLTKSVALDVVKLGITCNAVCPSMIDTDMIAKVVDNAVAKGGTTHEEVRAHLISGIPTGSMITPAQVAELVLFLVASGASNQMTGAAYLIDHGLTAE